MASLQDLQDALQNAHAAGDDTAARSLADEIVRQQMPWTAPTTQPMGPDAPKWLPAPVQAGLIGAGRTVSQVGAGSQQLGLGALIAGKQLFGMDNGDNLRQLAALDKRQQQNDTIYGALKSQFPASTAIGESVPGLAIPMGQATAAARILTPAAGMATIEGMQYGSPLQRATRAAVGFGGGLAGGVGGELAARAVQPVANVADNAAQEAAKAAAARIGAPLLPSQQTGNPTLAIFEDSLARSPGSAGVIGGTIAQQKAAAAQAMNRAIGQPATDSVTQQVIDAAKAKMGGQYTDYRAQIPNGMPVSQPVLDAVTNAKAVLTQGSTQAPGKAQALSMLQELEDKLYQSKTLTPSEYSTWVSDLSSAAREIKNPQAAAQLKGVGAVMDQEARGPLNPEWQKLDQSYAALKALQKANAYNPQTGEVFPAKLASYMRAHPSGANATEAADVAAFGQAVPQLRVGSPTFSRDQAGLMGIANMAWRYPLAKMMTSEAMREYLSKGLLASPTASNVGALFANKAAYPLTATPAMGLLAPYATAGSTYFQ